MRSRYVLALLLSGVASFPAFSQSASPQPALAPGYYVVVAAFTNGQVDLVTKYTEALNRDGHHAKYGYDGIRGFYYAYLDYYTDFDASIQEMLKTRATGGFPTAWVRIMKTGGTDTSGQPEPVVVEKKADVKKIEEKKAPEKNTEAKKTEEKKATPEVAAEIAPVKKDEPVPAVVAPVEQKEDTAVIDNPKAEPVYRPQVLTNTPVFISLYNPVAHETVPGDVEVVDTDRSKVIAKVKGNDYLTLPDPKSKSGMLTLVSTSFGYRRLEHKINYKSTEQDTLQPYVSLVGNYYMIAFDMIRLHQGDIAILYNVYFYNDAAVMLPESRHELGALLGMMKSNPNYKVRLHGHTNGNAHGKLITMGEKRNFFELTSDVKRGFGSAKDLSRERAQAIREWLILNSIAPDRIEVKAWGGSKMIHDKDSPHARQNVRVEVEILQE